MWLRERRALAKLGQSRDGAREGGMAEERAAEQGAARQGAGFDAAAYADAAAAALDLPLDPAHRPGVIAALEGLHAMSRLVLAVELPAELDPAPVYRP